ncbi:hypothetical protein [Streptomyces cucumeris]|uniref:hypothetical protein n=1 Tax=Streptomyces cucumeris TaxID=2962890 RepID=UPI0020C8477A|nr:hypothetical protein [Streptomyces sp. NEAU-Y11]MCP9205989.1 hypothetical protein [Streptomyces sp. NEAU-Y11]
MRRAAPLVSAVVTAASAVLGGGATAAQADDESRCNGPHTGLIVIDNCGADSWLEVDRTLDTLLASLGTAGSDHEGGE